jgi:hypothetical protein
MNPKQFVADLDMGMGEVWRGKCPVCNRSGTFTAINQMGKLLWNCYSNSCDVSGGMNVGMSASDIKRAMHKEDEFVELPEFKFPDWVIYRPECLCLTRYQEQYGIDPAGLDLRYDVKEDRIVFPTVWQGKIVDAIGRAVKPMGGAVPKWKRYGTARVPYVRGRGNVAVVVEDAISAAVVETQGAVGFALLGTQLLTEHKTALKKYFKVVVALDPDAASKTLEYCRELRSEGIDTHALKLYDDLKYRTDEDICALQRLTGV